MKQEQRGTTYDCRKLSFGAEKREEESESIGCRVVRREKAGMSRVGRRSRRHSMWQQANLCVVRGELSDHTDSRHWTVVDLSTSIRCQAG